MDTEATCLILHLMPRRWCTRQTGSSTPSAILISIKVVGSLFILLWPCLADQFLFFLPLIYFVSPGGYTPGVNQVVVQERRRDDAGDIALGMLAGAATGLALGSLFSVF